MTDPEIPSFARPPGATAVPEDSATLVRLHRALKELDAAIYNAVRELDIALGRNPTSAPEDALPYRELGRLQQHLEAATAPAETQPTRNLADMALDWHEDDDEAATG